MGIFDLSGSWEEASNNRFSTKVDGSGNFEFIALVNEDNSVPKIILTDLEYYLKKYERSKNIHYHLYEGTMFFGATSESGKFTCIYCEAAKMPLQTEMFGGIRVQHYRQVVGEGMSHDKKVGEIVYV